VQALNDIADQVMGHGAGRPAFLQPQGDGVALEVANPYEQYAPGCLVLQDDLVLPGLDIRCYSLNCYFNEIIHAYSVVAGLTRRTASVPFHNSRLLKNTHLLRCAHSSLLRRTGKYASFLRISRALHLYVFDQPEKNNFPNNWLVLIV
jgi:hypothetical protein